ncbi:MAG TPA: hypothetical protein PKC30_04810, partial [Saprospiraceae bacterium]|nr:hypothetical protein [Saprospiraceae bacterium]
FYFISTKKTLKHASADIGLIFCAYNLRRLFNILDRDTLRKYLRALLALFQAVFSHFKAVRRVLLSGASVINPPDLFNLPALNRLRFVRFD